MKNFKKMIYVNAALLKVGSISFINLKTFPFVIDFNLNHYGFCCYEFYDFGTASNTFSALSSLSCFFFPISNLTIKLFKTL
jgi:hypothetical protein